MIRTTLLFEFLSTCVASRCNRLNLSSLGLFIQYIFKFMNIFSYGNTSMYFLVCVGGRRGRNHCFFDEARQTEPDFKRVPVCHGIWETAKGRVEKKISTTVLSSSCSTATTTRIIINEYSQV